MALTKSGQAVQASASNSAGGTTTSSGFSIGYSASGVASIANGTAPTVGCDFIEELSNDGGTTWYEWRRRTAGIVASTTYRFAWGYTLGDGGDFDKYRHKFNGNATNAVTVQSDGESTTAL